MKNVHNARVVLFISLCSMMFGLLMLRLFWVFIDWWLLTKFYVLDISYVIGQCANYSGVDAVLKAESFSKGQGVIMCMYLYGSRIVRIEFNYHLNWLLLMKIIGNIVQLILKREWGIEYFLDNPMGLTVHI